MKTHRLPMSSIWLPLCVFFVSVGMMAAPGAPPQTSWAGPGAQSATPPALDHLMYLPYVGRAAGAAPTPTPTPTPTLSLPPVEVLPNYFHYLDRVGSLWIVGEVQNNTDTYLRFVRVTASVFDAEGHLVDVETTSIHLDSLPPGDKTCFDIFFFDEPAGWSYYEFEVGYWTDGQPLPQLTVFNDSGSYDPGTGWYEIIGQVRNDHGSRVELVRPIGTLYDEAGGVRGCRATVVKAGDLEPGQVSSFEMPFIGRDYADVASFRLQVTGYAE